MPGRPRHALHHQLRYPVLMNAAGPAQLRQREGRVLIQDLDRQDDHIILPVHGASLPVARAD